MPGLVKTNWGSEPVNTNWEPVPERRNLGLGLEARAKTKGWETQIPQKIKTKKIQWVTYASIDYVMYLDCWHFKLYLKTHFELKTNLNFKYSKFLLSLCGTKDKVKRKEKWMMSITVKLVKRQVSYKWYVILGSFTRQELLWWRENIRLSNGRKTHQQEPQLTIHTDASTKGPRTHCNGILTRGKFPILTSIKNLLNLTIHIQMESGSRVLECQGSFRLETASKHVSEHNQTFWSPMWPTFCNSARKCTPVKYKARQKAGFQVVT